MQNYNLNNKNKSYNQKFQAGSKFIKTNPSSQYIGHHDKTLTPKEEMTAVKGLICYVIIFLIFIPYLLFRLKFNELLKLYFLNTDQIATALSFDKGIFRNTFKYLYTDTTPLIGFISQTTINWSVLMGMFFVVVSELRNKAPEYILSRVGIILLVTYFIPSRYIIKFQHKAYNYLKNLNNLKFINEKILGNLVVFLGLILVVLFISFEGLLLFTFSKSIEKLIKRLGCTLYKTLK
mgnify:CR=1 FL=1